MAQTSLSSRLLEAMQDAKTNAAKLARTVGVSDVTIGNWVNDRVQQEQVKAAPLLRIAAALRVRPEWLLFGEGQKSAAAGIPTAGDGESQPVKPAVLTLAVQLVGSILQESELPMAPEKQAELITLVYELLDEGMPEAKVLRFARRAA